VGLAAVPPAQRIGLVEFDTFHASDVSDWLNAIGADPGNIAPIMSQLSQVPVNGGVSQTGPGQSEVLLDIDTVILGDPTAHYVVFDAPLSSSYQAVFNAMLSDPSGPPTVISNSWSSCEDQTTLADVQSIDSILAQAGAAGITVVNGRGGSAVVAGGYTYQTADVSGDGQVTPLDAQCVLRAIAALPATVGCPAPAPPGVAAPGQPRAVPTRP
jgi:subtilase family serine protease